MSVFGRIFGKREGPEIQFGQMARTISYKDSQDSLIFTFDIASSEPDSSGIWTVVLDPGAALGGRQITVVRDPSPELAARIRLARDRVVEYLRQRPYYVIDSEATNKA